MLFMIVETFKNRDAKPIYQRFLDRGRLMPEGLEYKGSWVEANFNRCFQLMECEDAALLQEWVYEWRDLVDFEIVPVVESSTTKDLVTRHL
jgi:Protein of unknown function (DUF3303)